MKRAEEETTTVKLTEMRSVREVARGGYSVSRAADVLDLAQPNVSRHVLELEAELGVELFERRRNRLVGLTPAGAVLVPRIDRIVTEVDDLQRMAGQLAAGDGGALVVATGHTHAAYTLAPVVKRFMSEFPQADLRLLLGHVQQIAQWVDTGQADVAVCAMPVAKFPNIAFHRWGEMRRVAVAPRGHVLLGQGDVTLQQLAAWPLITYDREYLAFADIDAAFREAGLQPRIVLSTGDTDVMKRYARAGLGVAILPGMTIEPATDGDLAEVPGSGALFPSMPLYIALNRRRTPSVQMLRFIELIAPAVRHEVERAARPDGAASADAGVAPERAAGRSTSDEVR